MKTLDSEGGCVEIETRCFDLQLWIQVALSIESMGGGVTLQGAAQQILWFVYTVIYH